MPAQAKSKPLEYLILDTPATVFQAHQLLYDMLGYRGTLRTDGDSASLEMHAADKAPVHANLGDVLLYKTSPAPEVVAALTQDAFTAGYDIT